MAVVIGALRHVEVRARDDRVVAAASLVEVLAARDTGGPGAVRDYEERYGVVPEAPIPDDPAGTQLKTITADEFDRLWDRGRRALDP